MFLTGANDPVNIMSPAAIMDSHAPRPPQQHVHRRSAGPLGAAGETGRGQRPGARLPVLARPRRSLTCPLPGLLRFGAFYAPFHPVGQSPTLALESTTSSGSRRSDRFGYDEVWFGEHHSGGYEIIGCPEIFVAVAAERTKHIRLGTGVVSLPYHHPWLLADRIALLDHLTRGRLIFGQVPGALPTDAHVMGIDPVDQRRMMEESLEAIIALFTSEEPDRPARRTGSRSATGASRSGRTPTRTPRSRWRRW